MRKAAKYGGSVLKSYVKRRFMNNGSGLTVQHDRARQYKYKARSRRARRLGRRKAYRFNRLLNKRLGRNTVLRNNTVSCAPPGAGGQNYLVCNMYGWNGLSVSNEAGADDVKTIVTTDTRIGASTKVCFTDCVMDLTGRNAGTTNLEVDVYEYWTRAQNTWYQNLGSVIGIADVDTPTITGAGSGLGIAVRGVTPFELPVLLENIKIYKKTKYLLPSGNAFTYQMKDRKQRMLWGSDIKDDAFIGNGSNFAKDGWTHGVLCVAKNIVGEVADGNFIVGATRVYRYTIDDVATAKDQLE